MSRRTKYSPKVGCTLAVAAALVSGVFVTLWVGSGFLAFPEPVNDVKQVVVSPDGLMKLYVFSRDSGATTGFNSQATITKVEEDLPDDGGTVFVTDKDDVTVSWPESKRIVVSMRGFGNVYKTEESVMGISIEYRYAD